MAELTQTLDLSLYEPQLRVLQSDPNTRIMGSIGRLVACQQVLGSPFKEFTDREALGLGAGRVSDIDVLGTSSDVLAQASASGDMVVDDKAFHDTDVSVVHIDGTWYLRSEDADFEEPLLPTVMKPIVETVEGVEITTVSLLVHDQLHALRERSARKDRQTAITMKYLLHQIALRDRVIPELTQEERRPFMQLQFRLLIAHHHKSAGRHSEDHEDRHSY